MFNGCSDENGNENEDENVNITLSQTKIEIPYKGEEIITISGIDLNKCKITVEDNYFIDYYQNNNELEIKANKVGSTKIHIAYKNDTATCEVNVTPIINYIGIPVIYFGENRDYIISKESNEMLENREDLISYYDSNILYGATHRYHFTNNKLEYILTKVGIYNFNGGSSISLFTERVGNSLLERYDYIGSYTGKYQNIIIYTFKNDYYIGARLSGGNGGWYICYAPTLEEIKKLLDVHPSIAIS